MSKGTINDIAFLVGSGITPLRSNERYWDIPRYPWLKTEQLGEFQIYDTSEYISQVALDETSIKLWPPKTLSIAMYGEGQTRGNTSIIMEEMTTNQACCNVVVDENKADYRYVYYWLKNSYQRLRILASGVRKNLNSDDIKSFPINYPSVPIQTCIADVLFSIDKKIALNKRINAELEAMAKTLYDYWFVQFDFPDENGKPYRTSGGAMEYNEQLKREIPKGWSIKQASDFTVVVTGKEDANFSTENGQFKFFTCSQDTLLCDSPAFEGHAVLIAGNGDFNVKHYTGKFNAYQRTYVLIPTDSKYYGCLYIASNDKVTAFKSGSNGSIVKFITKGDVEGITIFDISQRVLYDRINTIIEEIEHLDEENEELTRLRDWLLPMLMNGQATVTDEQPTETQQNVVELPHCDDRFDLWLQNQGIAARGDLDKKTLREIFDAMDDDDK